MDIPPIVLTVIGIGEAICQLIWRPMILLRIVPDVPMIGHVVEIINGVFPPYSVRVSLSFRKAAKLTLKACP